MKEIEKNNLFFEDIRHIDENGIEFWYARELMPILQYSNWQNFEKIIQKAKIACENSGILVIDHFTDVNKMVQIGSGAYREQIDYKLTRYACYLICLLYTSLHGIAIKEAVEREYLGINFKLVSADKLDFKLLKID